MFAVLVFVFVLASLILVHEFGHFYAAKKAGCDVEEFGLGFPPRLFKFKRGGTLYTINLLPLGGFVRIKGEDGADGEDPGSFASKSTLAKSIIILAGVMMNIVLAYVFISLTLFIGIPSIDTDQQDFNRFAQIRDEKIQIVQVLENSPAITAGIESGDVILSVDGQAIVSVSQVQELLQKDGATALSIKVERAGEVKQLLVTPETLPEIEKVGIGVGLSQTAIVSYPWYIAPFQGFLRTFEILWLILKAFGDLFIRLVTTAQVGQDVTGPIGIAVITAQVAKLGIVQILQFTAVLSLNLAIINVLPFPALDGSRFLFILMEKIRGKKLGLKFERMIHLFGFGLLMLLMVVITVKDVQKYGASIWQQITSFFA